MSWWGKLFGAACGFALGDYIGAILGLIVGHQLDRGLQEAAARSGHVGGHGGTYSYDYNQDYLEQAQATFFTTVFSVMGHLAKSDGHVSEAEIRVAEDLMAEMQLDSSQRRIAIDLFQQGKQADFPLHETLAQFRSHCGRDRNLMQMFIEILLHSAYADGHLAHREHQLFVKICSQLGFSYNEFEILESMVRAQRAFHGGGRQHEPVRPQKDLLKESYALLGISNSATDEEVKKAYRRQMNQHHPDKLVAKGLPEEMINLATEKTQEIKAAYDTICKARKMR
jgi:DnaJ like chaperone protein